MLVAFLPRSLQDERPITLFAMIYRLWGRIRKTHAPAWCASKAGFWDKAVAGSAPLQAALLRMVRRETAAALGKASCEVHWDVQTFYESIDIGKLLRLSAKLQYPLVELVLSTTAYVGVRTIQVQNAFSRGAAGHAGLGAGCPFAMDHARSFLHELLERVRCEAPGVTLEEWVGDLAQQAFGTVFRRSSITPRGRMGSLSRGSRIEPWQYNLSL